MHDVTTKQDFGRWTHPVVISSGQRSIRDGHRSGGLRLMDRTAFDADIVVLSYHSSPLDTDREPPMSGQQQPEDIQPVNALAMAMLGVSSDLHWVEYADDDVAD